MDEILASIRRIIADDQDRAPPAMASASAAPDAFPEDAPELHDSEIQDPEIQDFEIQDFESQNLEIQDDLEDGNAARPAPAPELIGQEEPAMSAAEPAAAWERPADPLLPEIVSRPATSDTVPVPSGRAEAQVAEAFGRLVEAVKPPPAPTLEEHVTAMLRPMLKAWLDENLPALAERLVQEEIDRIRRSR